MLQNTVERVAKYIIPSNKYIKKYMGSGTSHSRNGKVSLPPDPDWSDPSELISKSVVPICPKVQTSFDRSGLKKSQTSTNKPIRTDKDQRTARLQSYGSTNASDNVSHTKGTEIPRKPSSDSNSQASADLELCKTSSPAEGPELGELVVAPKMMRTSSTNSEPAGESANPAKKVSPPHSPQQKPAESVFDTSNPVYISKMTKYPNCEFVKKYGRSNIGQMICIRDKNTFEEFTICV